jgi:hypothetical protein
MRRRRRRGRRERTNNLGLITREERKVYVLVGESGGERGKEGRRERERERGHAWHTMQQECRE